jgi:hypothetical protein
MFGVLYFGSVILLYWGSTPLHQLAGLVQEMLLGRKSFKRFAPAAGAGGDAEGSPAANPEKPNELVS